MNVNHTSLCNTSPPRILQLPDVHHSSRSKTPNKHASEFRILCALFWTKFTGVDITNERYQRNAEPLEVVNLFALTLESLKSHTQPIGSGARSQVVLSAPLTNEKDQVFYFRKITDLFCRQ